MKVLITSGGTRSYIDPVRYIGNVSTGRFGSQLATEFLKRKKEVFFYHATRSESPFKITTNFYNQINYAHEFYDKYKFCEKYSHNYGESNFKTYKDYNNQIFSIINNYQPNIIVLAAAVSDFEVVEKEDKIISELTQHIELVPTDKIINKIKETYPNKMVVGFKLVYNKSKSQLEDIMRKSMQKNNCDMIVGNDLFNIKNNNHDLTILTNHDDDVVTITHDLSYYLYENIRKEYLKYF